MKTRKQEDAIGAGLCVAIIGPSRCGKDTVARLLRQQAGLKYVGSVSWWCKEYVGSLLGLPVQEAWETRNEPGNGELWGRLIDQKREGDPGCILRQMLNAGAQIISGIRRRAEFAAVKSRFTHILWVERPGTPVDPTLELGPEDCTHVILNDGTLEELELRVELFLQPRMNTKEHEQKTGKLEDVKTGPAEPPVAVPSSSLPVFPSSPPAPLPAPPPSGPWIQTISGKRFYLLDPRPEMVDIGDIAHALALLCRFTGHTKDFFSVAEHSVNVSYLLQPFGCAAAMAGLLHDAAEAYIGDVNNPLKVALRQCESPGFEHVESSALDRIEWGIKDVIAAKFGVDFGRWKAVGQVADMIALKQEAEALNGGTEDWTLPAYLRFMNHNVEIPELRDNYCWFSGFHFRYGLRCQDPKAAREQFLKRFEELRLAIAEGRINPPLHVPKEAA